MFWAKPNLPPPKAFYDRLPTYAVGETGRMLEAMHADGFVLIPEALGPKKVEEARDRVEPDPR